MIQACFDKYEQAVVDQDGTAAASCISSRTIEHYNTMRLHALTADAETVKDLPTLDKLIVLRMRLQIPVKTLEEMDGRSAFAYGIQQGWTDKSAVASNDLGSIDVRGNQATAVHVYLQRPTSIKWEFQQENGEWKMNLHSFISASAEQLFDQAIKESGKEEDAFLIQLLEAVSGKTIDESIWEPLKPE